VHAKHAQNTTFPCASAKPQFTNFFTREVTMKRLSYILILLLAALTLAACQPATPITPETPAEEAPEGAYPPAEEPSAPAESYPAPAQPVAPAEPSPYPPMEESPDMTTSYIRIESPANGAMLTSGQPVTVSGMGAGLFEGNVVVQVLDANGSQLAMQATILQSPEAGTGGEGPWSVELTFSVDAPGAGKIVAFSPSPKDGEDWLASDEIAVTLLPENLPLEGTPWLLRAFPQADDYNTLAVVYQVTANFDPAENRLSGTAGCNTYNTSYTTEDGTLTVNTPIALTRMMCDRPQMALEGTYTAALENIAAYEIVGDRLTILDPQGNPVLEFQVDPYTLSETYTREALGNLAYLSEFGENGTVQLTGGQYRAPAAEGSASEIIVSLSNFAAFGDLNGDGVEDAAVILVSSGGGSGVFYDLAVVIDENGTLTNVAIDSLGDRVQVKGLQVTDGEIVVSLLTHAPSDPLCCATQNTILHYQLVGDQLTLVKTETDK
jgi:heat shock protein HslJ